MKKLMLYIILSCYTITIVKPVLPYISDLIGHVFFYSQHIATVHYENGNYHVHHETVKAVKEENSDKSPAPSSKKDNSQNEHIITTNNNAAFLVIRNDDEYALTTTPSLISSFAQNNYPPPRI